jgi:DNA-binding NarL/FixJ family response regulator
VLGVLSCCPQALQTDGVMGAGEAGNKAAKAAALAADKVLMSGGSAAEAAEAARNSAKGGRWGTSTARQQPSPLPASAGQSQGQQPPKAVKGQQALNLTSAGKRNIRIF